VAYPFLGVTSRTYTQFRDLATGLPLVAQPGRSYDMAPVNGLSMPVPPGDGLWGPDDTPAPPPPPAPLPAPPAPPVTPAAPEAPAGE
jgi:hypothetical protein